MIKHIDEDGIEYVTIAEAMRLVGCNRQTIINYMKDGIVSFVREGVHVYIEKISIPTFKRKPGRKNKVLDNNIQ